MSAAKNWVFTINNYSEDDIERIEELFQNNFNYIVIGREVGEQGTHHLQGYVQLKKKLRLGQVRNLISLRGHYEVSRGHPRQASEYCKTLMDSVDFEQVRKTRILLKRVNWYLEEVITTLLIV